MRIDGWGSRYVALQYRESRQHVGRVMDRVFVVGDAAPTDDHIAAGQRGRFRERGRLFVYIRDVNGKGFLCGQAALIG